MLAAHSVHSALSKSHAKGLCTHQHADPAQARTPFAAGLLETTFAAVHSMGSPQLAHTLSDRLQSAGATCRIAWHETYNWGITDAWSWVKLIKGLIICTHLPNGLALARRPASSACCRAAGCAPIMCCLTPCSAEAAGRRNAV